MISNFWIVIVACLAHRVSCSNYLIDIIDIRSGSDGTKVYNDEPAPNEIKLTLNSPRDGCTFRAQIYERNVMEQRPIDGSLCEPEEGDDTFIAEIVSDGMGYDKCPIAAGDYQINRKLLRENVEFKGLPKGFQAALLLINIYGKNNVKKDKYDMLIQAEILELTADEAADIKKEIN